MIKRKVSFIGAISAAVSLLAGTSAFAMQSATSGGGLDLGISPVGGAFAGGGSNYAMQGFLSYGIRTGFLGHDYTAVMIDGTSIFANGHTVSLSTIGISQPVYGSGSMAAAIEGGFSAVTDNFRSGNSVSVGGVFVGLRGTDKLSGGLDINGILRYHSIAGANLWQAGVGASMPIAHRLRGAIDYTYNAVGNGGGDFHMLTAGVIWFIPSGPNQKRD